MAISLGKLIIKNFKSLAIDITLLHPLDKKYLNLLPSFIRKLNTKVWFIGCAENDFPISLVQVLRLGLEFIPYPTHQQWDRLFEQQPHFKALINDFKSDWQDIFKDLKSFLQDKYKVTETDKNMGIAIITKELYNSLSKNVVNDTSFTKSEKGINILMQEYYEQLTFHHKVDFIKPKEDQKHLPSFIGLPKVHKSPVKLRPVVNARSCWTTNQVY